MKKITENLFITQECDLIEHILYREHFSNVLCVLISCEFERVNQFEQLFYIIMHVLFEINRMLTL